ncbi:MAG: YqgE/AlgH family protein [Cytophagaceae bacterium]|nr:YqgE/AlgH family protein [Cytophagaceae bacterium]
MPTQHVKNGDLLIAEPFLGDPNFERSVVLICEHNELGSFGLVWNQTVQLHLDDVLSDDIYPEVALYVGGPVEKNTLHFIHRRPDLISKSRLVAEGIYWGGDFDEIRQMLNLGTLSVTDIRFFIGYSGWSAGQLSDELKRDSWIVTPASGEALFDTPTDQFWRAVLRQMGGQYRVMSHYPTDPRLN